MLCVVDRLRHVASRHATVMADSRKKYKSSVWIGLYPLTNCPDLGGVQGRSGSVKEVSRSRPRRTHSEYTMNLNVIDLRVGFRATSSARAHGSTRAASSTDSASVRHTLKCESCIATLLELGGDAQVVFCAGRPVPARDRIRSWTMRR